jgi:hypothetical protein
MSYEWSYGPSRFRNIYWVAWLTGTISIVSIIMLNSCCVVLIIYTKTPSTWPTISLRIVFIIILNKNCIIGKPLSHVNIPYIYLEEVYIGLCVTRLGYTLVNIGGFFREEDIKYSPCNLKHPKSLVGNHVSFQGFVSRDQPISHIQATYIFSELPFINSVLSNPFILT